MVKKIKHYLEYLLVIIFLFLFKILGVKISTKLSAIIAKFIGKMLPVTKLAKQNIFLSNINKNKTNIDDIINGMWDNIGRNIAEMAHLKKITSDNCLISQSSKRNIEQIKYFENGAIFVSAHIGNWELSHMLVKKPFDIDNLNVFYKEMNNPMVNNVIIKNRKSEGINFIEKSKSGNREIVRLMKKKSYFGILVDLYITKGQKINFLGRSTNAMTTAAKLSIKYNKPIIPLYCKRLEKESKFELIVEKPIDFKNSKNIISDQDLTVKFNKIIELWIKKNPDQWFWVHNRWKNKAQ